MTTEDKSRRQLIDEAQGKFEQAGTQMAADKARVLRLQAELLQAAERSSKSVQAYADAEVALAHALTGDSEPVPSKPPPTEAELDRALAQIDHQPFQSAVDRETVDAAINF